MSIIDVYHHKGYGPGCLSGMFVVAPWGSIIGMILGAIGAFVYIRDSEPLDAGILDSMGFFISLGICIPIGAIIGAFIGMLVNLIIIKIIDMNKTIKVGDKEMKVNDMARNLGYPNVKKMRDLDGFYGGNDVHYMNAVAICSMPHNAINPMTGKRYTSAEHADPVQVAAWFHEPNKMVYDYKLKMNVPYKK